MISFLLTDSFDGFDTKVLELKTVFNMKGNFGRKRRLSVFVITGNRNGLVGFATGKALESRTALRKAKNRAGQKLMHINVFRNHTGTLHLVELNYSTVCYEGKSFSNGSLSVVFK